MIFRILRVIALSYIIGIFSVISVYKFIANSYNIKTEYTTVYKVLPVLVIYDYNNLFLTNKEAIKEETPSAGSAGPIVFLYNKHDKSNLIMHELTHAKQFYRYGGLNTFLYFNFQKYRIKFEYDAYMVELDKISNDEFVKHMHNFYNITLTSDEIYNVIEEYDGNS